MKKIIFIISVICLMSSCTSDFVNMNRDPYGATPEELDRLPKGGSQILDLQNIVLPQQENSFQMCFDLFANMYAGYVGTLVFPSDFSVYNPRLAWINYPQHDTYPKIYNSFFKLKNFSNGDMSKPYFALASILRVGVMDWLADTYGPLPYSKMEQGKTSTPYDSEAELYNNMCEDLKAAVEGLKKADPSDRQYKDFDVIYKGDLTKWIKYANSLLLRLAVRISKPEPVKARTFAEYAIQNGVITTNEDNALYQTKDNPAYKTTSTWSNSAAGADIVEYMKAFNDPRLEKYFTKSKNRSGKDQYFGLKYGNPAVVKPDPKNYSMPNIQKNSPIVWISAAEVAFLKAEGALKGWNMGKSAKELYEEGVNLSFAQWDAKTGNYLSNNNMRRGFIDPLAPGYNLPSFRSNITVNWDAARGDKEKQLSKIITQKWIALYPYNGHVAWTEWRRTGYPNLMPAQVNQSGGLVQDIRQVNGKDVGGMRRLPFIQDEKNNNSANVQNAVKMLGGPDTGGTNLWWAK